jgi:cytochrome c556
MTLPSKTGLALVAAVLATGLGVSAMAAIDAAQVITTRQENLKALGKNFKALREELAKGAPDKAALVADAQTIDKLAQALPGWFPAGSGPEAGVKTAAKPEIWAKPAEFKQVAEALAPQTHKLVEAAATGDVAVIGAQAKETGAACGACHKEFKVKDD